MTAHSIDTAQRHRRLPGDLVALVLILAALYLAARLLLPQGEPTSPPPAAIETPASVPALPVPQAIEPPAQPAPRQLRRAPTPIPAAPTEAVERDPFAGLEPLSAQELDAISQAH